MIASAFAFWLSVLVVVYAYVGYPLVLWLLTRFINRDWKLTVDVPSDLPTVTLVISAYNEESVICQKIENALALDYPKERLEIIVVSDGSTDRTCEIVSQFASDGVQLHHFDERAGKTACLNRTVPQAKGSIIIFSDANSTYQDGALHALVQPFQDNTVGFVTGWTQYGSDEDLSKSRTIGIYSRLELMTKVMESRIGSCIGADGAIFAIRKALYVPLESYDINDFVIPLSINQQGYRGVLQPAAVCIEKDAGSNTGEFYRQVRITSRTIRAIMNYRRLLNPFRFGMLAFEIISHKLCKFLVPIFLVSLLLTNALLIPYSNWYLLTFIPQVFLYTAAATVTLLPTRGLLFRIFDAARTFVIVNGAMAMAWVRYFQGETYTTWAPTKR